MLNHIGELAALGTSICYSFGSLLFTFAGREIGTGLTNRTRLLIALLFVMALNWLTFGQLFPTNASPDRWFWLGLSGLIGFIFGDACLFEAFLLIGPRLSMLMMAFAPALSVILAWLILHEALTLQDLIIIAIIIGGIAWVVSERAQKSGDDEVSKGDRRKHLIGLLFGLGASVGQAGGYVLSKVGLADDFPALTATLMRLASAVVAIWLVTIVRGGLPSSIRTLKASPRVLWVIVLASFLGPVLGVWLSLVAVQRAPVGIASTLSSLTPIILLPIVYVVYKEKISRRAIVGTVIVIAASTLLFF